MTLAFILLVIGAVLLCCEMFIPGFGIFGICGVIMIIISAVFAYLSGPLGALIVLSEITLLAVFVFVALNYVKKRQFGKLILNDTLDLVGDESEIPEDLVGRRGIVINALRPVGTVDFDDVVLEAYSESGFIQKDQYVKVTRVDRRKVYVRALEQ